METFSIIDLDSYADIVRSAVASSYSETYTENLDDYITIGQVKNIIETHILGFDDNDRYVINEDGFNSTFEEISVWLHEVALAKLAAQGKIECAWDDEIGDMVFWATEKQHNIGSPNE